jgi:transcriptional regulator with XRE-family HTH domain
MASRETDLQAVGRRVRAARQQAGLSEIALALAVNCSRSTIVRLERGDGNRLNMHRLRDIAETLGVTFDSLLVGWEPSLKGGDR